MNIYFSPISGILKKIEYNQDTKKGETLCRYCSETFSETEKKYHINEKELLVVVRSCKKNYLNN